MDHVYHRDGAAEIFHVSAAVGDRLYGLVTDHEGIEGFVAETGAAVCVKSYQQ